MNSCAICGQSVIGPHHIRGRGIEIVHGETRMFMPSGVFSGISGGSNIDVLPVTWQRNLHDSLFITERMTEYRGLEIILQHIVSFIDRKHVGGLEQNEVDLIHDFGPEISMYFTQLRRRPKNPMNIQVWQPYVESLIFYDINQAFAWYDLVEAAWSLKKQWDRAKEEDLTRVARLLCNGGYERN